MNRSVVDALRWPVVAIGAVALAVVLARQEYREVFLSGAGIAQGALIAAIALGIVLTYRGSGVVNLANGAVAMFAAYVYTTLRSDGDLFLPPLPNPLAPIEAVVHWFQAEDSFDLPDIPGSVSFGPNMKFWPALILALVFCVLLGLAMHFLVFRPLRNAPPLAKVVASVGVFLLIQSVVIRRFTATPRSVRPLPFADKSQVDLGIVSIAQDQLFVAAVVVVCAVALWFVFQRTRFGLATRAAAENEKGAVVLGYSPDLLAGANWVLSTVITGLLGILVASVNANVDPIVIPALVVPALTAALVGGFSSFGWTTLAAFLLGMQLPLVQYLGVSASWFPQAEGLPAPGVDTLVPLIVIVLVLFFRGDALPARGSVREGRLPKAPSPPAWALRVAGPGLFVLASLAAMFWLGPSFRGALTNSAIGVIICLSLVVITGFVGQISLAPMAFAGMSAFVVAELSDGRGWPFPLPILAGALAAAVVGVVIAVPALRIRGVSLAIVTLAFGLAMDRFVFDNPTVNGGLDGARVDRPSLIDQANTSVHSLGPFTIGDGKQPNPLTTVFCLAVAFVLCYAAANVRRSASGRRMLALRSNERAAAAAGVDVARTKVLAFAVSAFIAGIGGAVIAYRQGRANQGSFSYEQSLVFFAFAYLGGISRVSGALVGGALVSGGLLFTVGDDLIGIPAEFTLLLGGLGVVVTAVLNPEGIAGGIAERVTRLRRARGPGGTAAPEPSGSAPEDEPAVAAAVQP
jgi:branched-chain amino acid transport system permease protein